MSADSAGTPSTQTDWRVPLPPVLLTILALEAVKVFFGLGPSLVVAAVGYAVCIILDRSLADD